MSSSVSFGRKRIPFLPKILVLKSSNGTHTQKKKQKLEDINTLEVTEIHCKTILIVQPILRKPSVYMY